MYIKSGNQIRVQDNIIVLREAFFYVITTLFVFCIFCTKGFAQFQKPKVVVGIVIDQMRWDYLSRFKTRFGDSGFNLLTDSGFNCENVHLNYLLSSDAPGYASIYSGATPSVHGITSNNWFDKEIQKSTYCVSDNFVITVGGDNRNSASPKNLLVTTLGDQMRLHSSFSSKVFSISLTDRAAVISGGHSANAAYWYDSQKGNFISSSYYMPELPDWVNQFNEKKIVDSFYANNWELTYPMYTYKGYNDKPYYSNPLASLTQNVFPYVLNTFIKRDYSKILYTPYSNSLLLEFAKELIKKQNIGKSGETDLLSISFSGTDYIGHAFGPNSIQMEDAFLKLDKDISGLIKFLNVEFGKDNYLVFLTSDHGVSEIPAFLMENRIPGEYIQTSRIIKDLDKKLVEEFSGQNWIKTFLNPMIYLNDSTLKETKNSVTVIKGRIKMILESIPGILKAVDLTDINNEIINEDIKQKIINGVYQKTKGDILLIYEPNRIEGPFKGTGHGSSYNYDTHIPLIFFGNKVPHSKVYTSYSVTDITPTISAMLEIQEPNGSSGNIITEIFNNKK